MTIEGAEVEVTVTVEVRATATRNEGNTTAASAKKTRKNATGRETTTKGTTNGRDAIASIITDEKTATRKGTGKDTAKSLNTGVKINVNFIKVEDIIYSRFYICKPATRLAGNKSAIPKVLLLVSQ